MTANIPPPDHDRTDEELFKAGTQYYVAARFGAFAGISPVTGNLFHHAIELYLKGALANRGWDLDTMRSQFGHRLPELWARVKSELSEHDLDRFDQTIEELHRHEHIRYPDFLITEGMVSWIQFTRHSVEISTPLTPELPRYVVVVDEIDELTRVILEMSGLNPAFFSASMVSSTAKDYFWRDNKSWPSPK